MLTLDRVRMIQGDFELRTDLEVATGARVAVMGPSGAGKSTLLSVIAGFLPIAAGHIRMNGAGMETLRSAERPVSIVFQDSNLFPHMSAFDNVALGLRPDLRLDDAGRESVGAALDRVGLAGFGNRKPRALSGGQQSRVALARVLMRNRPLLLLDEPFAALGPALKRDMLDLVDEIASEQDLTVLMVSHDPEDARHFSRQVIVVADGVAHAPQETGSVLDDPPEALRKYL